MTAYRALVPFSGGIDSTAALYRTLSAHRDDSFLVFRVQLVNGASGSRAVMEDRAVNGILDSLRAMGLRHFTYRRLAYDYSQLGAPPIWDSEAVNFAAATCLRAHPEITEFIEGAIADDYLQPGFDDRLAQIAKILYLVSERTPETLTIHYPLRAQSKAEVMRSIPRELLAQTWSCRFPVEGPAWDLKRCRRCHACLLVDHVLEAHPDEFADLGWT